MKTQQKGIARGVLNLSVSQAALLLCGYAIHIFLAKNLGPETYGVFGFIITLLAWLEIFTYGLSNLSVKYINTYTGDFENMKVTFDRAQLLTSLTWFAFLSIFGITVGLTSSKYGFLLLIAFLDVPLIGFYQLYQGYLNGFRLFTRQAISSIVYSFTKAGFIILFVAVWGGVGMALLGNVCASLFGLLAGYVLFRPYESRLMEAQPDRDSKTRGYGILSLIKESFSFILIPLFFNFIISADIWIVGVLIGGEDVGYYVSASTIARTVFFLFASIFMVIFPSAVASFREGGGQDLKRIYRDSADVFAMLAFPFMLVIAINAPMLVELLFGPAYGEASSLVRILSVGMLLLTIMIFHVYILYAAGKIRTAIVTLVVIAVCDAILLPILTGFLGLRGAAIGTTSACFLGLMLIHEVTRKGVGLAWEISRMVKALAFTVLCFVPLIFIPRDELTFIPLTITFSAIYLALILRDSGLRKRLLALFGKA